MENLGFRVEEVWIWGSGFRSSVRKQGLEINRHD